MEILGDLDEANMLPREQT